MNIAGVGLGDMGPANLKNLESENIVALCDVDPTHAAKTIRAVLQREVLYGLSRDARPAEGHRGCGDRDARPHACGDHDGRDSRRQARLLPEAPDSRCLRGPDADQGSTGIQGSQPRWESRDTRAKASGRRASGSGPVSSARFVRSMPGAVSRITPGAMPGGARNGPIAPRRRCPCLRG